MVLVYTSLMSTAHLPLLPAATGLDLAVDNMINGWAQEAGRSEQAASLPAAAMPTLASG